MPIPGLAGATTVQKPQPTTRKPNPKPDSAENPRSRVSSRTEPRGRTISRPHRIAASQNPPVNRGPKTAVQTDSPCSPAAILSSHPTTQHQSPVQCCEHQGIRIRTHPTRDIWTINPCGQSKRVMGIEPTQPAWKAGTLPLSYTRLTRKSQHASARLFPDRDNSRTPVARGEPFPVPPTARSPAHQNLFWPGRETADLHLDATTIGIAYQLFQGSKSGRSPFSRLFLLIRGCRFGSCLPSSPESWNPVKITPSSGGSRIRTCEGLLQQIYSLSRLAASVSPRNSLSRQLSQVHLPQSLGNPQALQSDSPVLLPTGKNRSEGYPRPAGSVALSSRGLPSTPSCGGNPTTDLQTAKHGHLPLFGSCIRPALPGARQKMPQKGLFQLSFWSAKPAEGFEPPTSGLQNRCSTTELRRQKFWKRNECNGKQPLGKSN